MNIEEIPIDIKTKIASILLDEAHWANINALSYDEVIESNPSCEIQKERRREWIYESQRIKKIALEFSQK